MTEGPATNAAIAALVRRASSSFYWPMRLLPPARREAMFAIYAFCREVDDIADGDAAADAKLDGLATWREEIDAVFAGAPHSLAGRGLVTPVRRYALDREHFTDIIDGLEMDVMAVMRGPPLATLELYCYRVAGAVGLLSIKVFGAAGEGARAFALSLGQALQLTNILRDLAEDAGAGRLYLPGEMLAAAGIAGDDPEKAIRHPAIATVCDQLAALARRRFDEAARARSRTDARALRPALVMMAMYGRLLERLCARGWDDLDRAVRLGRREKLWLALRHGLI